MPHLLLHFIRHIDQSEPIEHSVYVGHAPDITQSFWSLYYFFFNILQRQSYRTPSQAFTLLPPVKGNRIELSEEGKEVLNQKSSQLWKGQEITIKYFTDGYYENVAGVLDAVDVINKELRIYTGFINDTGKELPTIIAFEDILEIGVNMT